MRGKVARPPFRRIGLEGGGKKREFCSSGKSFGLTRAYLPVPTFTDDP